MRCRKTCRFDPGLDHLSQMLLIMYGLEIDYTDTWYDGVNDCYANDLSAKYIYMYLDAITDSDYEQELNYS